MILLILTHKMFESVFCILLPSGNLWIFHKRDNLMLYYIVNKNSYIGSQYIKSNKDLSIIFNFLYNVFMQYIKM